MPTLDECRALVGKRVRLTEVIEGKLESAKPQYGFTDAPVVRIQDDAHMAYVRNGVGDPRYSIEEIPEPEPKWEEFDVVLDADGDVFERSWRGGWLVPGMNGTRDDDYLVRPLTLVARDGKPWPSDKAT